MDFGLVFLNSYNIINNTGDVLDESIFIVLEDGTLIGNVHLSSKNRSKANNLPKNYFGPKSAGSSSI